LSRARGLGSAKGGTGHWWQQRLTAIILVPLTLWLVTSLVGLDTTDYDAVSRWLRAPVNAVCLIIFILTLFHHTYLGVQVVIEDYIHSDWQKLVSLILLRFLVVFACLSAVLAIIKVFLGL